MSYGDYSKLFKQINIVNNPFDVLTEIAMELSITILDGVLKYEDHLLEHGRVDVARFTESVSSDIKSLVDEAISEFGKLNLCGEDVVQDIYRIYNEEKICKIMKLLHIFRNEFRTSRHGLCYNHIEFDKMTYGEYSVEFEKVRNLRKIVINDLMGVYSEQCTDDDFDLWGDAFKKIWSIFMDEETYVDTESKLNTIKSMREHIDNADMIIYVYELIVKEGITYKDAKYMSEFFTKNYGTKDTITYEYNYEYAGESIPEYKRNDDDDDDGDEDTYVDTSLN